MFDYQKYRDVLTTFFVSYGIKIVGAVLILFIGLWVIQRLVSFINVQMQKHEVDPSLRPFLQNVLSIGLRILLILAVISQLGMAITSILAVLGSAGLAIGLALQGSLSNFAGGVLILAAKPFRVGDNIEAQGVSGKVCMINILHTIIKTPDNKTIYIPNGPLANSTITNFDLETTRRAEIRIVVQYENDIDLTKRLIQDIIKQDDRILTEPAPQVVSENTDTGIVLITRVWALREHIGGITNDLHDLIRSAFTQHNIAIAWRQPEGLSIKLK